MKSPAALNLNILESPTAHAGLLEAALDASAQFVLVTDRKGNIVFANQALALQHGRSREDLIGESVELVMPSDKNREHMELLRDAFRASRAVRVVVRGHHPGGAPMWLNLAISPVCSSGDRASHFIGIATDITESIEDARIKGEMQARIDSQAQEQERLTVELRLAQKLEALGRLAAGVAHEINTPIQYISDNVTFMRDSLDDFVKVISAYEMSVDQGNEMAEQVELSYLMNELPKSIDRTQEGVRRVANIVRAMKEFSHPGSDAHSLADLNRALERTLEIARSEYKHVATVEMCLGSLPHIPCNIGELNQVFLNMLVNAAHAIEKAGRDSSSGRISITSELIGAEVILTFEDNGCGIPSEHLDKIFEPFFTTKEVGKGTGQGLAITRSIVVDRHRGSIDVDSVVGTGTRITLHLPVTAL
ncbi:MAG: ATP-binding protein [Pseudomonadota bacterium]